MMSLIKPCLHFQIEPLVGVPSQSWAERQRCAVDDSDEEGEDEVDSSKTLTSTVDVDAIKVQIDALYLASKMSMPSLGISFQRSPPHMMRPPPPPPPKPAASNKLMTIPEDWDKSGVVESISSCTSSAGGGGAIASTSSSSASLSSGAANPASNKHDSDETDDSGSESDGSTSNDTSDSEECSGSSSSTCSSTDSECSCSGSSCDQSRPSPSMQYGSSKKGGNVGKEKTAAATASSPSYAIAATKSRVLPTATTTVASTSPSPMPRPVPVESIKTEHRSSVMSGGVGDVSGAPSNVIQETLARPPASTVLEMAPVAVVPPKRKSLVSAVGKTNAMGNHQMVPREVPILPPPPIALLQTIPATSIVFKSEPIYISQAESCIGSDGINSLVQGAIIQSTRCSGARGRIAPKLPIHKDSAAIFSKPILPLMPPPVSTKAASAVAVGAVGGGGGVKRTEFRLRPESDILKQSVVRAAAAAATVSIPGRSGSAPVTGPRVKASGSKKKKSSANEKVSSIFKKLSCASPPNPYVPHFSSN